MQNTRGATSMETATALENLAGSLEGQAKWSEARAVLRQALDMRRSLISPRPDSPQIGCRSDDELLQPPSTQAQMDDAAHSNQDSRL